MSKLRNLICMCLAAAVIDTASPFYAQFGGMGGFPGMGMGEFGGVGEMGIKLD